MRKLLVALSLTLAASPVLADSPPTRTPDVQKMATDDCARARKQNKTCVLSIEDEQIEGTTPTYGDPPIVVDLFGKHGSLITLRRDFIPEILKTAEDL